MAGILAILVAAIAMMVVGFLWYSPSLFGKAWMSLSGMTKEKIEKAKKSGSVNKSYAIAFVMTLITAYVLNAFILKTQSISAAGGMAIAFWAWLGFMAAKSMGMFLWESKPMKLYWINTLHDLVSILIAGAILGAWA